MALTTEEVRRIEKHSIVTSTTPTVAPSSDHTDGSWTTEDIYPGELFINLVDQQIWTSDGTNPILLASAPLWTLSSGDVYRNSNVGINDNTFTAALIVKDTANPIMILKNTGTDVLTVDNTGNLTLDTLSGTGTRLITADFLGQVSDLAFGTADQVLAMNGAGTALAWVSVSTTSIYDADGTLTGERTLDGDGNNLLFVNLNSFRVESDSGTYVMTLAETGLLTIPDNILISGAAGRSLAYTNNNYTIGKTGALTTEGLVFAGAGLTYLGVSPDGEVTNWTSLSNWSYTSGTTGYTSGYGVHNANGTAGHWLKENIAYVLATNATNTSTGNIDVRVSAYNVGTVTSAMYFLSDGTINVGSATSLGAQLGIIGASGGNVLYVENATGAAFLVDQTDVYADDRFTINNEFRVTRAQRITTIDTTIDAVDSADHTFISYAPTAAGGPDLLTNILGGYDGRVIILTTRVNDLTIQHAAGGAGQILCPTASDFTLSQIGEGCMMIYDGGHSAWVVLYGRN